MDQMDYGAVLPPSLMVFLSVLDFIFFCKWKDLAAVCYVSWQRLYAAVNAKVFTFPFFIFSFTFFAFTFFVFTLKMGRSCGCVLCQLVKIVCSSKCKSQLQPASQHTQSASRMRTTDIEERNIHKYRKKNAQIFEYKIHNPKQIMRQAPSTFLKPSSE